MLANFPNASVKYKKTLPAVLAEQVDLAIKDVYVLVFHDFNKIMFILLSCQILFQKTKVLQCAKKLII